MFVAYRGFSVILFAPIAALGAVFLTDPHAVPAAFTSLFMEKMVGFAKLYFPVFLLGAVLTYGGVSLFVVVFAAYPFAAELFRAGNIPKRLIPGTSRSARSPSPWTLCRSARKSRTSSRPPISRR